MSIALRGEGLEKRFGRVAALRGVDFALAPGDRLALLGANGAGKTSLLRIVAGLSRPSAGRLEARPAEAADAAASGDDGARPLDRAALRARVGYVGHATLLYGELSARENLMFAARLHGRRPAREALDRLLEDFDLGDVADRRAGGFSRGMAQRLAIARALVHEPSLLLLDEPFTGLDERSAERLAERLAALPPATDGGARSLVVVTHDPRRAVALADRALLLHHGTVRDTPRRGDAGGTAWDADALRARLAELAREPALRGAA